MADWVLIPCLKALFAELDRIAPGRDHTSDGSIGDTAHQHEVSDHNPDETGSVPIHDADHLNEVHAIDVDTDLRESDLTMEKVVQFILGRCRSGAEKRLRYVIYYRRIWSASSGWVQKAYNGPSPHTEHAHFSASYDSALEASTASWHLEEIPVSMTEADRAWVSQEFTRQLSALRASILAEVPALGEPIGDPVVPSRTLRNRELDDARVRGVLAGDKDDTAAAVAGDFPAKGVAPLFRLIAAADKILAER